jgi:hypothetical protein
VVVVVVLTEILVFLFVLALFLRFFLLDRRTIFFFRFFLFRNVSGGANSGRDRSRSIERLGSGD